MEWMDKVHNEGGMKGKTSDDEKHIWNPRLMRCTKCSLADGDPNAPGHGGGAAGHPAAPGPRTGLRRGPAERGAGGAAVSQRPRKAVPERVGEGAGGGAGAEPAAGTAPPRHRGGERGRERGGTGARRRVGRRGGSCCLPARGREVVTAPPLLPLLLQLLLQLLLLPLLPPLPPLLPVLPLLPLLPPLLPLRKSMCAEFGGRIFKVCGQSVANTPEESVTG
uniref:RNA-binding protein cabeza-like n=1 Tax=Agelaius phoeniceus TaxID=39638 RepID=UPI0023EE268A|nr:RNA-binding protein cabeza-like [Agelaius phoeniceus]